MGAGIVVAAGHHSVPAHRWSVRSTEMSPRSSGPRRSESVDSYLRQTRAAAALALLALAGAIASEQVAEHLWVSHPLLAGLASSAIIVMLSVAVVNEALEIRRRRRWRVLAQYVMLELVLAGSLAWLGSLLDQDEPSDGDQLRRHRAQSNPAVQITGDMDDERLAQRLVAITQLAEQLDRGTLELAVKIVPVAWWEARLGTTAHAGDDVPGANGQGQLSPAQGPV
jgi:hypothetical protein